MKMYTGNLGKFEKWSLNTGSLLIQTRHQSSEHLLWLTAATPTIDCSRGIVYNMFSDAY